jgi:hypothetical protein
MTTAVSLPDADVMAMAEAARMAPSIHNSQPWTFERRPDGLAVREDLSRGLPVIDPHGRERAISCGAAVLNASIALQAAGYSAALSICPDPGDPTLLGVVRAVRRHPVDPAVSELMAAIPRRRTHRRVYRSHVVAEADLLALREAVSSQGARLDVADTAARRQLAHLMRRALRAQLADSELRREAEDWVRRASGATPGRAEVDGIPAGSLGNFGFPVDSLAHAGNRGDGDAGVVEEELARSTVLVIATRGDTSTDWVLAGMAVERLLLVATVKELVASFAEQALQQEDTRQEVAQTLGQWGRPQVLLRIGRALVDTPPTPRRPLADLLRR